MSKKAKGQNAFYFFMLEWKRKQEKKGRVFPNGLKDISNNPDLNEEWRNLPKQQKGYYEAQAKESKIQAQGALTKKTALGESIDEVYESEKREQEFHQNMLQYIESVVSMGTQHNNLEKIKFIFIHVNWFYKREIGINKYDFCPAEFAIAEFSLENGIENMYHEIINAKIPLGWRRDAYETSMETHKIPVELKVGEENFALMYDKLIAILKANKTGNKFPPLYTAKDMNIAVESLLKRMTEAAKKSTDDFVIYSLEALFGALRNAATQKVDDCSIPLVIAEIEFGKDIFVSEQNLECSYHKNIDGTSQYCSMAVVKRWGFTICDHCCEFLNIPMIKGIHCPVSESHIKSSVEENIEVHMNKLNINEQCKMVSMTGVSEDYRRRVSERSYQEEQRRRNECKPLEIIDHSKFNTISNVSIPGRPLRLPKTKSRAVSEMPENLPSFNASDFPPMGGRGTVPKKDEKDIKFSLGRGRGKC
ncbi:protein maelstrom homolog [Calliopsis andreniformis]|uniref:protein maelstrom homolog n=1 Tax=Calliopsis andreniformis TaxID=337506 RepID=UPI003FCEE180